MCLYSVYDVIYIVSLKYAGDPFPYNGLFPLWDLDSDSDSVTALDNCFNWGTRASGHWLGVTGLRAPWVGGSLQYSGSRRVPELLVPLLESDYCGGCGSTSSIFGFCCTGTHQARISNALMEG